MEKILFVIIGGIVGFLASIAKDYFVEKTKKRYQDRDFKREKLEELFIIVSRMFNQSIKPIEARDEINDYRDDGAKAALITRFYLPSIFKDYQKYIDSYICINQKTITNYKSVSKDELSNYSKEYQVFLRVLESESKKYC